MQIRFTVDGLPPKKDGANSMWRKDPEVARLVELRQKAHAAFAGKRPIAQPVRLFLDIRIPATLAQLGDLDSMVTGVLDGLQRAALRTPWRRDARWLDARLAHIAPDAWAALADDRWVERLDVRRSLVPAGEPHYIVKLECDDPATSTPIQPAPDPVWEVCQGVIRLRSAARMFLAVSNANTSRWFGGSQALHRDARAWHYENFLMGLRRITDIGAGYEPTLPNLARRLHKAEAARAEADPARLQLLMDFRAAANAVRDEPNVRHLRQLADKTIAHLNMEGLKQLGPQVEGHTHEEISVVLLSRAAAAVSGVYRMIDPRTPLDAVPMSHDAFRRRIPYKGLPVLDYSPQDGYRGDGDEDWSRRYVTVERATWDHLVLTLPKPWPYAMMLADLRILDDGQPEGPDIAHLAERWGLAREDTARIIFQALDDRRAAHGRS